MIHPIVNSSFIRWASDAGYDVANWQAYCGEIFFASSVTQGRYEGFIAGGKLAQELASGVGA